MKDDASWTKVNTSVLNFSWKYKFNYTHIIHTYKITTVPYISNQFSEPEKQSVLMGNPCVTLIGNAVEI
jgi:hypothetical protein